METLNAKSHFTPLFHVPFYNGELSCPSLSTSPQSPTHLSLLNQTLEAELLPIQVPDQQNDDSSEETLDLCQAEEAPIDNGNVVPITCEPPRETAFCMPEAFVPQWLVNSDEKTPEREYFMRCVMVGAKNTGKHGLIEASFCQDKKSKVFEKTGVDLVTKTSEKYQTMKKYQFWLRTLNEEKSETKEVIWQTYYKTVGAIIFVYDIGNRKSFEALEEAIQKVLEVVPREKFYGILVGNQVDEKKKREVSLREGMDFKSRYNFSHFIETNEKLEEKVPEMLNRVDAKLKLTFEAMW